MHNPGTSHACDMPVMHLAKTGELSQNRWIRLPCNVEIWKYIYIYINKYYCPSKWFEFKGLVLFTSSMSGDHGPLKITHLSCAHKQRQQTKQPPVGCLLNLLWFSFSRLRERHSKGYLMSLGPSHLFIPSLTVSPRWERSFLLCSGWSLSSLSPLGIILQSQTYFITHPPTSYHNTYLLIN